MATSFALEKVHSVNQEKLIVVRASMSQECESCKKQERYMVIPIPERLSQRNAAHLLLNESPLATVIKESFVGEHSYLLFRCLDSMCLLKHTREALSVFWVQEQMRQFETIQKNKKIVGKKKRGKRNGK